MKLLKATRDQNPSSLRSDRRQEQRDVNGVPEPCSELLSQKLPSLAFFWFGLQSWLPDGHSVLRMQAALIGAAIGTVLHPYHVDHALFTQINCCPAGSCHQSENKNSCA